MFPSGSNIEWNWSHSPLDPDPPPPPAFTLVSIPLLLPFVKIFDWKFLWTVACPVIFFVRCHTWCSLVAYHANRQYYLAEVKIINSNERLPLLTSASNTQSENTLFASWYRMLMSRNQAIGVVISWWTGLWNTALKYDKEAWSYHSKWQPTVESLFPPPSMSSVTCSVSWHHYAMCFLITTSVRFTYSTVWLWNQKEYKRETKLILPWININHSRACRVYRQLLAVQVHHIFL